MCRTAPHPDEHPDGTLSPGRRVLAHLAGIWRYYAGEQRKSILSSLSLADSSEAVMRLRGVDDIHIRSGDGGTVVIHSSRHCGIRGRPLIPFLHGQLRQSPGGVVLEVRISIEPCARAMVILFWLVIGMAWVAILDDPAPGHVLAGGLTTAIYWGILEIGHWIGRQDVRHITDRLSAALGWQPDRDGHSEPRSIRP